MAGKTEGFHSDFYAPETQLKRTIAALRMGGFNNAKILLLADFWKALSCCDYSYFLDLMENPDKAMPNVIAPQTERSTTSKSSTEVEAEFTILETVNAPSSAKPVAMASESKTNSLGYDETEQNKPDSWKKPKRDKIPLSTELQEYIAEKFAKDEKDVGGTDKKEYDVLSAVPSMRKRCSACNDLLPLHAFDFDDDSRDGRAVKCKLCLNDERIVDRETCADREQSTKDKRSTYQLNRSLEALRGYVALTKRGFPTKKPERLDDNSTWTVTRVAKETQSSVHTTQDNLCRLRKGGYLGRTWSREAHAHSFWITQKGLEAAGLTEARV
jgi:hypothetical protein